MKTKLLPILLVIALLSTLLLLPVSAARLTPAADLLAEDAKLIKSGYIGQTLSFNRADFKQALGVAKFDGITLESLPDEEAGSLKLAGSSVKAGQRVAFVLLDLLKFVPKSELVTEATFSFSADGLAGGAVIPCQIRLLDKRNAAPTTTAGELTVETQKGISYYGTLGAKDPEGDTLCFRITEYPKKGTLTLINQKTGEYRYTPSAEHTGKDKFSYVVRDEYGNFSYEKEVSVETIRRTSSLVYTDIAGGREELAAIALTEAGILLGRLSGDGMYFDPDKEVSRGDFTVMAMKAAGITPYRGLSATCFDDDEGIPDSIRPYIATAQANGYISGSFDGKGLYFEAERAITAAEAAVILARILGCDDGEVSVFATENEVPVWAESSVSALYEMGVISVMSDSTFRGSDALSRADAAMMLYTVMKKTK